MIRATILIFLIFISSLKGRCDVYYTVQPVEHINLEGNIWNLRDVEPRGASLNYRLENNDSTLRLWSPTQRFDLFAEGKSFHLNCTETRKYKLSISPAIPINKYSTPINAVDSFYVTGRIMQSEFITGKGVSVSKASQKGYCNGSTDEDYIEAVLLHDTQSFDWYVSTDSLATINSTVSNDICTTTIDSYRVVVEGEEFPRAFKRKMTTEYTGQVIYADSLFWVCEQTDLKTNESARKTKLKLTDFNKGMSGNQTEDLDLNKPAIYVHYNGEMLNISSNKNCIGHLQVCDAIGRIYYNSALNLSEDNIQVQLPHLPSGEYIISINDQSQNAIYVNKVLLTD